MLSVVERVFVVILIACAFFSYDVPVFFSVFFPSSPFTGPQGVV